MSCLFTIKIPSLTGSLTGSIVEGERVALLITLQPVSLEIEEYENAEFIIMAEGAISYQWQEMIGGIWTDIPYTTNVLNLGPSSYLDNGRVFRCVVSDGYVSVDSDSATLTVIAAPAFTQHPQSASLYDGDNLLLTATSTGTLPITHQWQFRPFYTGEPYQGQTLTSAVAGQWYINDVAVPGETGGTFVVPETVLLGDEIRCGDFPALEVIRIPGSFGISIDTTRTTEKTTDSDQFHMMGRSGVNETITIYWGDGTKSVCDTWDHADRIHTYADEDVYDVQVVGVTTANFDYTASLSDLPKIVSIDQWGDPWGSNQVDAFRGNDSPHVLNALPDDAGHGLDSVVVAEYMFRENSLTTLPDGMTLASLANGTQMFIGNNLATLPDGMTLNALNDGAAMFYFNNLATLPDGMTLDSLTNGAGMFTFTNLTALPDGMTLDSLTNGDSMFFSTNLTTLPDSMTLASLNNGNSMFYGSNLTALPDGMTLDALTNGGYMFSNNNLTTLPDSMTLASLTNGTYMFSGNTINTEDYSGLLIRMEANNPNANVTFHGGNSKYNSAAAVARAELVNRGWTITDGGPE